MENLTDFKYRPLYDRVILLPDAPKEEEAGVLIPTTGQERPQEGTVIAVGPGTDPAAGKVTSVKPGDRVVYGKNAGTLITIDGVDYSIMREMEILAAEIPAAEEKAV